MKARLTVAGCAAVLLVLLVLLEAAVVGTRVSGSTVHVISEKNRDAYALVFGQHWMGTNLSIEEMERVRVRYEGSVLWFRRHREAYVVRDRAKLEEARALFDSLRALEPKQADLARRQKLADRKEEAVDQERDRMEDRVDDEDRADRDPSQERARDQAIRELDEAKRKAASESRRLDEEERALDRRSEELERAAESKLWVLIDRWIADGSARKVEEP